MLKKDTLEDFDLVDLHPGMTLNRIHHYFCKPLFGYSLCYFPDCSGCKPHLDKVFARLNESDKVRSPYGLLVWLLADERASLVEKAHSETKIRDSQSNAFEDMLEQLG